MERSPSSILATPRDGKELDKAPSSVHSCRAFRRSGWSVDLAGDEIDLPAVGGVGRLGDEHAEVLEGHGVAGPLEVAGQGLMSSGTPWK